MKNSHKLGALILGIFFWNSISSSAGTRLDMSGYTPTIIDGYNTGYLTQHPTLRYNNRSLGQIEQVVVHHFAQAGQDAKIVANYHTWHKDANKNEWPGAGYSFIVNEDGTIVICFPLSKITYGIKNENTKSISVALAGDFDNEQVEKFKLRRFITSY